MEHSNEENEVQREHITNIFKEYTTPSRLLRSFTNLSNTVIQTALSGQSKFVFEILQNADDAFEDQQQSIEVQFILQDGYLIVHHNGKGFDFNDVERICDYASQIEEVKANDLSKTGYKGLGFKSLFNLSDCIYIYSNGYSFRFDKTYWSDAESKPWQVIPIWCRYDELPLNQNYSFDQPVNFILRLNNVSQLKSQLTEVIDKPELLLYLHRINKVNINLKEKQHFLERRIENFGIFHKIDFYKNQQIESTWISRAYKRYVSKEVQTSVRGGNRYIYPAKIKKAKEVIFNFTLKCDKIFKEISKIKGLCYSTLPTQLHLMLPYHINSLFILNLDRTQLHENEWNEFLMYQVGSLQLNFLKDLAEVNYLKNYVIELLVREINHPYRNFSKAFLKGFEEAKYEIGWLPAHHGLRLLKLGEAWIDQIEFFKQNFQKLRDHQIYPYLINFNVKEKYSLSSYEAARFTYDHLFRNFSKKYYPQLTRGAYIDFITYLYERLKGSRSNNKVMSKLKKVSFLLAKDRTLQSPNNALLEESENPIPECLMLNPIDNDYLPSNNTDLIKNWLVLLGARRLTTPIEILRESILEWINSGNIHHKITMKNHFVIINYLAKWIDELTKLETEKLRESLLILTESNEFKLAKTCYLPDVVPIKEFSNIISDDEKISSSYDMNNLREFFIHVGVHDSLNVIDVLRKTILLWIENDEIKDKLTASSYKFIIELIAVHYPTIKKNLTFSEKMKLENIPVLTCDQTLQKAKLCYFDSAIPNIKGFESVIAKNRLISSDISEAVYEFLLKIGVSEKIAPIDVIRRSVIKWTQEGVITNRITRDNHHEILSYVGKHWSILNIRSDLKQKEKKDLKMMPILTEAGVFRAACRCFWPVCNFDGSFYEEIPGLQDVISSDEFVSSSYDLEIIKSLLEDLGVHSHKFTGIYEKYSNHLTLPENVKWFFTELVYYWEKNKANKDQLLSFLQQKLSASSCLLAKNGNIYSSTELYSTQFYNIYDIDPNSILLLDYEKLPEDLEVYLGFKTELDFECIKELLKAIERKTELGKEKTRIFFSMLLEQLRLKDKNEIRKHQLRLLSNENKLRVAKELNYFVEKDATCVLSSCYLKRIHGMSHDETLELAELCGVNILPFEEEIQRVDETYDNTLKEFYLERLPFIVVQESKKLNEAVIATLRRLYEAVCSIKLYQCRGIYVVYPFGEASKIQNHFAGMILYVVGKWFNKKSTVHDHLRKSLRLKTDIRDIIDLEQPITQESKQDWLLYHKQDPQNFYSVEKELKELLSAEKKTKLDSLASVENAKNTESYRLECDEQQSKDKLLINKEECIVKSSSDESSVSFLEGELYLQKHPIKNDGSRAYSISVEELKKQRSSEVKKVDLSTLVEKMRRAHSEYGEKLIKDCNLLVNKNELPAESSADESSVDFKGEPYLQKHPIKDDSSEDYNITVEKLKKFLSSEEKNEIDLSTLVENVRIDHHSEYGEKLIKDCNLLVNKDELADESPSNERSVIFVKSESHLQRDSLKDESTVLEPEVINRDKTITDSIIDFTEWPLPNELKIDRKKRMQQSKVPDVDSLYTESSAVFPEVNTQKSNTKYLNEKYVFAYLQDHYKNKYPNSQFTVLDGTFTLKWQSHRIEIVWLNVSEDLGQPYDLVLKKGDEVKRLIEVKSTNYVANNDSFNTNHRKCIRKIRQLASELPDHKEKYCIYHVFNRNNSSELNIEELNRNAALYKVVPLKNEFT